MKSNSFLKINFYSLIIIFVILVGYFLVPIFQEVAWPFFFLAAALGILFLILGTSLAIISRKEKGKLRIFLMITGISAICPFVFTILHNFFYALGIVFENLNWLFEFLHASSFIISLLIAPIAFIVGTVGSIILFKRKDKKI